MTIDGVVDNKDPWESTWVIMTANLKSNTTSAITAKFQLTWNQKYIWLVVQCDGDATIDTSSINIPLVNETDGIDVFVKLDTNSN